MDVWTKDLKSDGQTVELALAEMELELELAKKAEVKAVKFIHGYGSHGKGGAINLAVRKRLLELLRQKKISGVIYGEEFNFSNPSALELILRCKNYFGDEDLNGANAGMTIVVI